MAALAGLLERRYGFVAVPDGDGWHIRFPDLPGCTSYAETWEDVGPMARTSFEIWMKSEVEQGHPIPEPGERPLSAGWGPAAFHASAAFTADDAAARLGVSRRRVHQLATTRGVGHRIGNARLFTEADLAALTPGQPGRPRKTVPV